MPKDTDHQRTEAPSRGAGPPSAVPAARAPGTLITCLVVRCTATKNVFGHVVPCKGADDEDLLDEDEG